MQASNLEMREQERNELIEMRKWCLGMPASADRHTKGVIMASVNLTMARLKAMPRLVRGGVRQLQVLRKKLFQCNERIRKGQFDSETEKKRSS